METEGSITASSDLGAATALNLSSISNASANASGFGFQDADAFEQPTEEELRRSIFIFYLVIFVMIVAQSSLVQWRKRDRRSYELVTLIGLWLIPPIVSVIGQFWLFLLVWGFYSGVTGTFLYKCTFERAMDKRLPKQIYRWFFVIFRVSIIVGMAGYIILLASVLTAGLFILPIVNPGLGIILLWYGLYFGVLNRDCAEVASDRIATRMGGSKRLAVNVRDCAICGGELADAHSISASHLTIDQQQSRSLPTGEASIQLSCKHIFHSDCMRGWAIIGKKDSCPVCNEKVDLRALYADRPWETRNLSWVQMLDFFRYMVVWQPTILLAMQIAFHVLHLDGMPNQNVEGAAGGSVNNGTVELVNITMAESNGTVALL